MIPTDAIDVAVRAALAEDLPWGDVTSDNLSIDGVEVSGIFNARQSAVVAGLPVVKAVFAIVAPDATITFHAEDGAEVDGGSHIATVACSAQQLLHGERVALNFVQRLSGIATLTHSFVDAVAGTKARIVDTRKTTPGLRALEKYAVRCGGGANHRFSLSDAVLVKDNHLAAMAKQGTRATDALRSLRERIPFTTHIEVEVDTLEQLELVLESGVADSILIDNFDLAATRTAVEVVNGRSLVNASGNVRLDTVRDIALTGVDLISVGALTHSAPAIDIGLDVEI